MLQDTNTVLNAHKVDTGDFKRLSGARTRLPCTRARSAALTVVTAAGSSVSFTSFEYMIAIGAKNIYVLKRLQ